MSILSLVLVIMLSLYNFSCISEDYTDSDIIGNIEYYTSKSEETLIDISRKYNLSFPEVLSSNPHIVDPWLVLHGTDILLPTEHILPRAKREGIVINLADLRAYYFKNGTSEILTFPIGVGRNGWETPLGEAHVTGKKEKPYWKVPKSILEEDPSWPPVVPPGPDNPLGDHAIYLSMPSYLLHGTNKAWGVGMRVSHGCIRLYPEGIEKLYNLVSLETPVTIVDQPIKAGWRDDKLYVEVHIMHEYGMEEGVKLAPRNTLLPEAAKVIQEVAGIEINKIDWSLVVSAVMQGRGLPVSVMREKN